MRFRQRLSQKWAPALWLSTLVASFAVGACVTTTTSQQQSQRPTGADAPAGDPTHLTGAAVAAPPYVPSSEPIVQAVQKAAPAVVSIDTTARQVYRVFDDPYDAFTGQGRTVQREVPTGAGSGVLLEGGYVLTNQHVVGDAVNTGGSIRITLADGRPFEARAVGADYRTDLAVLKVNTTEKLPMIPLGSQDTLVPGQTVIAIGNPVGLSASVSAGVVSALGRPLTMEGRTYENLIQTDTAINPGNSGGALIDLGGNLVGINTLVRSDAQNIGFAISIKTAMRIADTLKRYGRVRRPDLGVVAAELSPRLARYLSLPRSAQGVVVAAVYRGSPAAEAGLQRFDVITAVGGKPVSDEASYQKVIEGLTLGKPVDLTLLREGQESTVSLRVAEAPQQ